MSNKPKTLQDIFRERQMKDMKREYYFYRVNQIWTIIKRLALVGSLGYGVHWGYKNSSTLKSFFKAHSAPVQEVGQNFKEGMDMIKDTLKEDKNSEEYHKQRKKCISEYKEIGIDPTVKYATPGTKEYSEELEFYRRSGVFKAND